jgi:hypothetical protein
MIAQAKLSYRGVLCIHCRQPTPISASADHKEREFEQHGKSESDEFSIFANPLRCRGCNGEAIYTPEDVKEFDGPPRKRILRRQTAA